MRSDKKQIFYNVFTLLFLTLFNPLIITFFLDTGNSQPDTFIYLAEAMNIHDHFQFNSGIWGHVDTILILPPLYPVLIAILMFMDMGTLDAALLISQLSGLLFTYLSFFYIRSITSTLFAFSAVVSIHLTFIYFHYFSMALTEALFLFVILASLLVFRFLVETKTEIKPVHYLMAGLLSGLSFLTRELGISVIIFFTLFLMLRDLMNRRALLAYGKYFMVFTGFLMLVVPFYTLRYMQTGQEPLSTSFRAGNYTVVVDDREILDQIEGIRQKKSDEYLDVYKKRRVFMHLLPDGSEMLNKIIIQKGPDAGNQQDTSITESLRIFKILRDPGKYISNLADKLVLLKSSLGTGIFILFIGLVILLLMERNPETGRGRVIIPGFVLVYLLLVSIFDTEIKRYVEIISPLVLVFIAMEIFLFFNTCLKELYGDNARAFTIVLSIIFPVMVIAGTPQLFYEKKIHGKNPGLEFQLAELGKSLQYQPVFTQFPVFAHAVNGKFRNLPNDTLDKIAVYANKTGVEWLLIVKIPEEKEVMQLWDKAYPWISDDNLPGHYNDIIKYHAGFHDEQSNTDWRLYRFGSRPE